MLQNVTKGLAIGMVVTIIVLGLLSFILWLWVLIVTLNRQATLSPGKQTACIVLLLLGFFGFPIIDPIATSIIVYSS